MNKNICETKTSHLTHRNVELGTSKACRCRIHSTIKEGYCGEKDYKKWNNNEISTFSKAQCPCQSITTGFDLGRSLPIRSTHDPWHRGQAGTVFFR